MTHVKPPKNFWTLYLFIYYYYQIMNFLAVASHIKPQIRIIRSHSFLKAYVNEPQRNLFIAVSKNAVEQTNIFNVDIILQMFAVGVFTD